MNVPGPVKSDESRTAGRVFVSYATADRKQALSVTKAIERRGIKCWISTRDVEPGGNYQEEIVHAIRDSRAMVLVFSEAANHSDEIKKELSLASRYHVPVMALRIEDVEPSDAFAYELSTRQWIDAFEGWDHSIDALVRQLDQAFTGTSPTTQSHPEKHRRARIGGLPRPWVMALAVILLLAVAASAAYFWYPFVKIEPLTVQIGEFKSLGGVPQETGVAFQQALADAFGDESAVRVKQKDATYVLSGTIRNTGDKIEYATRLTDSHSGEMLWSASRAFDSAAGAAGPQQAAVSVTWVIRCGLAGAMQSSKPLSARALSLYLGLCQLENWGGGTANRRLDLAKQLVAEAPYFSRGWSQLAWDASAAATNAPPNTASELKELGTNAVHRALALDPSNGNAYLAAAYLVPWKDWAQREAMHKRSVEVRESDCGCEHEQYALLLLRLGRPKDAVEQAQRAVDMQPNSPSALDMLAISYYANGDIADGDRVVANRTAFWKGSPGTKNILLYQAMETKRWGQAAAAAREQFDEPTQAPLIDAFAALASGNQKRIAAAKAAVVGMPPDLDVLEPRVAFLAAVGDISDALAILKPLNETRFPGLEFLLDPQIAPLRNDPVFTDMLRERRIVDYWRASKKLPQFCSAKDAPPFCKTL